MTTFQELKAEINASDKYVATQACLELIEKCEEIAKNAIDKMSDQRLEAENIARFLHNNYEILAEKNGWNTQLQTKGSFDTLPVANRKTMNMISRMVRKFILDQLKQKLFGDDLK